MTGFNDFVSYSFILQGQRGMKISASCKSSRASFSLERLITEWTFAPWSQWLRTGPADSCSSRSVISTPKFLIPSIENFIELLMTNSKAASKSYASMRQTRQTSLLPLNRYSMFC